MKIVVLTDSGSGLSLEEAQTLGLEYLALQVSIEGKSYRDAIELSTPMVYQALREGKFPKTASPLGEDIHALFERLNQNQVDAVIYVGISAGLSGTQQALITHSNSYAFTLIPIEIHSTSRIQKNFALQAKRMVDQGHSIETILRVLSDAAKGSTTLILPSDLNHLRAGGRLTPIAASLASMLKIRPVLQLNAQTQGKIDVLAKIRTDRKALEYAIEHLSLTFPTESTRIELIHAADDDRAHLAKSLLIEKGYHASNIDVSYIAAVIAAHTGLGCLGLQAYPNFDGLSDIKSF